MSKVVLKVENVSKQYRLGQLGTGTISHDLNRWWHTVRGKEDPYLKLGDTNDRSKLGGSDYVWSLRDINFEVQQGEVLGIIGKNGAGKSTLLKILSQVTTPTTGSVKARGRIAALLEVGTGFHPDLSGRENIFLNGAILGMTKHEINSKLDEIVDFSGVAKYLDTPVKRYSSGMMVRLGFAVAAHLEPEILIVDEVLAVGDAEFQKKCLGKMKEVSGQGRTVLFVSHNMAAVQNLCTTGLMLEHGQIKAVGGINDIISAYTAVTGNTGADVVFDTNIRRTGNGNIQFEYLKLYDDAQQLRNTYSIGETIRFEFLINNKSNETKSEIAIQVKTNEGVPVLHMMARDSNVEINHTQTHEKYTVVLDDVRLFPDNYTVSITCANTTGHEVFDTIEDAVTFTITDGGKYTNRALPKAAGMFFMNPKWIKH
jgi:lipopolysaccharide transport system ATP-binding protein